MGKTTDFVSRGDLLRQQAKEKDFIVRDLSDYGHSLQHLIYKQIMANIRITDLPQKNFNEYDIECIMSLKKNGCNINKGWKEEDSEASRRLTNKRTKSIAHLFKFFTFPIDYLESVLDFYRGDINLAFRFLNDQEKSEAICPECHKRVKREIMCHIGTPQEMCYNCLPF